MNTNKRLYSFVSLAQQQEPPKLNLFLIKGTFFKNSNDYKVVLKKPVTENSLNITCCKLNRTWKGYVCPTLSFTVN